jgi:hypothetical protein
MDSLDPSCESASVLAAGNFIWLYIYLQFVFPVDCSRHSAAAVAAAAAPVEGPSVKAVEIAVDGAKQRFGDIISKAEVELISLRCQDLCEQ